MNVLIHGATHTTNFGDVLFAYLFYKRCEELQINAHFLEMPKYHVSDFCKKELNYINKRPMLSQMKNDALIMMSGGYLGDDKYSKKNSLKRYLHYILPARLFELSKKPVYIIGVGGGPLISKRLRKACVKMLNNASYISVRDIETKKYFEEYGVTKNIVLSTDTAQVINSDELNNHHENMETIKLIADKKHIFLHAVNKPSVDAKMSETIAPAINRFLNEHPDYDVVIGSDEILDVRSLMIFNAITEGRKTVFDYNSIFQLCCLLDKMSFVVTPKLHVGIVSASLGKSVLSFPIHREKTERYYRQIGEQKRCVHMDYVDEDVAYNQINEFYDIPIIISSEIRNMARNNLSVIDKLIHDF